MYDKTDPRSRLGASSNTGSSPAGRLGEAQYGLFYDEPPGEDDVDGRTWWVRGQNFIIAYSDAKPGAAFERADQADEYMVLLPDPQTPAVATSGSQQEQTGGFSLLILPPGPSRIILPNGGRMIRIFSTQSPDLVAKCANADAYGGGRESLPFEPWPAPPSGFKIRVYSLDVTVAPGRFGRIWRSTNLMVNVAPVQIGPRDVTKVSPHHHDDFEQCSLILEGTWRHHMRWPWSVNMNDWREDVHVEVGSPSVTVIPAGVIHTSTYHSQSRNHLVDIFAPPRVDFSLQPDWVLNEDEYPMPAAATSTSAGG